MDIVSWIFESISYDQNKPILIDTCVSNRSISASQARRFVRHVVAGLKATGLKNGDYVCILSYNQVFFPILCLGIIGAGGCVTGCNPSHTAQELASQLKACGCKYIITEFQNYSKTLAAANECGIPSRNLYICDPVDRSLPRECRSWTELLQHGVCDWVTLNAREAERTPAVLYTTSGTTGLPKSAMMSHAHCIDVATFIEHSSVGKPYKISRLISLPLLHAFAAPIVLLSAFREGITTYLMPRFDLGKFVDVIETFEITEVPMVPAMMVAAVSSDLFVSNRLKSVRQIWTAGAPLSLTVQTKFQNLLSREARIVPVYGTSECGWITSLAYPEVNSADSVGRKVPGMGLKLIDDDGNTVNKDGQLGELMIRPQHPTLGYVGNPSATAELFYEPGWIRSGDVAYVRDNRYYIVDRKKDIIKVRAWQVSPAELENVLMQHKCVRDVAVIGVPDNGISGETPHAFIVRSSPTDNLDLSALKSFMNVRLARYKQIEGLTFVDSIPRNPAGKILRRQLKEDILKASVDSKSVETVLVPDGQAIVNGGYEQLNNPKAIFVLPYSRGSSAWLMNHTTISSYGNYCLAHFLALGYFVSSLRSRFVRLATDGSASLMPGNGRGHGQREGLGIEGP